MPEQKRVLVTGANGLLGSNVVHQLAARQYHPVAMVRKGRNRSALLGLDCEILEADIADPVAIDKAVSGCEFIIHCAARTVSIPDRLEAYREINVEATDRLLKATKEHGIKRFIYVSTANCFTNGTLELPGTEEGGFMPWLKGSGYAYSKYLAQQRVLFEAQNNGLPALVVAPTFLIGPRDGKVSSGRLLLYGWNNRIIFYPPGGKSFVDAETAAEATVQALTNGKPGESYLLSGENVTYREFFRTVRRVQGKRKLHIPIPRWVISSMASIVELLNRLLGVSLLFNRVNQRLLCLDNYFDNSKARAELRMKETDIENSIHKAMDWFRANR